jgi:hypothetical protein
VSSTPRIGKASASGGLQPAVACRRGLAEFPRLTWQVRPLELAGGGEQQTSAPRNQRTWLMMGTEHRQETHAD